MLGSNGGSDRQANCPLCGKNEWAETPTPLVLAHEGAPAGFGLRVKPFICQGCGFVALMTVRQGH
jgi:predicted Zn-ribbon and HTH transcriptional regulator